MNAIQKTWSDFPALQLVRTTRSVRIAGQVTLVLLLLSIGAMTFLPWQQTASGTGIVVALDPQQRPQAVKSAAKGVVDFVKPGLREGSYVTEGETLIELVPTAEGAKQQLAMQFAALNIQKQAADDRVTIAEEQIELQGSSNELMRFSLEQQLEAARQKVAQAEKEAAVVDAELTAKENDLRIAEDVIKVGIGSEGELVTKRQAVAAARQKSMKAGDYVQESKANLAAKEKEVDSKKKDLESKMKDAEAKLKEQEAKVQSFNKELAALEIKKQELDRLEIKAPRSGFIQQWYGLEGSDTVKEGDPMFVVVPEADELAIEMIVSGNDMPLIHEGDQVRLQMEGWPAVQFVGWPSVAIGTFGGKVNRVFPTDDGKGNFRVLVTPDIHRDVDIDWPLDRLRQGVRANGWVLLNQVPLGYEVWRQLNGFPPTIDQPKKEKPAKVKLPK